MSSQPGKIIIISAPSGSGKSTIVGRLIEGGDLDMQFSISATNRPPRGTERHGVEYYFLDTPAFEQAIAEGRFVEYEEVYPGRYYGTLRSEIDRITSAGHNVILDIDVCGGVNVKRLFGDKALSLFIQPPSIDELRHRLESRATDSAEEIAKRLAKAEYELSFAPRFDTVVINDRLDDAVVQAHDTILKFISS